ncbi:MAG: GNAT family N-acetyltransferase, partial [Candidatus Binatia bacterium]
MEFRRARAEDFSDILRLQAANLIGNLNPQDRQEGFLSAEFTRQQLAEMASEIALLVASEKAQLFGYLCTYSCNYSKQFPILAAMIQSFGRALYQGKPLSSYNSFIYGPVCIDKSYRGRGLLRGLYEMLLREVAGKYEVGIAFVSKDNPHSLAAHVKGLGMCIAGEFEFNGR